MVIYSIDQDTVEPVFYPVVPDSFMKRNPGSGPAHTARGGHEWKDAHEALFVIPHDPWSF